MQFLPTKFIFTSKTTASLVIGLIFCLTKAGYAADSNLEATVEEKRIEKAANHINKVVTRHDNVYKEFASSFESADNYHQLKYKTIALGDKLWQTAKDSLSKIKDFDDRGLYWQRLKINRYIRAKSSHLKLSKIQREELINLFEKSSRGLNDLSFKATTHKKIILTGFDPFLLDRNINQSNPSGVVAMLLDGMVLEHKGITAEINSFMVPVRYTDFDQGFVETSLAPYYIKNDIDMITTVSMGRKDFDLERFPGKRRSASAPDNNNLYSGGSKTSPIISKLGSRELSGKEFVEFSLPVEKMIEAQGKYKVIDNHQVSTLKKTFKPESLTELKGEIAVSGSGGGYLSNEISYRSIRLKNELNSSIPTGHIHTPRIQQYDPQATSEITKQIIQMLKLALEEI
ncbi:MAG: hypothetical protein OQK51_13340 [Kangiellaceae bacterium]|nr:hypothetical protein [Kangiellaceae bacterium]